MEQTIEQETQEKGLRKVVLEGDPSATLFNLEIGEGVELDCSGKNIKGFRRVINIINGYINDQDSPDLPKTDGIYDIYINEKDRTYTIRRTE